MAWYRDGTVSVTNGSTAVTGVGTLWTVNAKAGDIFTKDAQTFYEIASVEGDGALTLVSAYQGATQSGVAYAIIRNFTSTTNADLASRVANLLTRWQNRENEMINWLSGTAGGGVGNDGKYPLSNILGVASQVKCPAQMQADINTIAAQGQAFIDSLEAGTDTINLNAIDTALSTTAMVSAFVYDTRKDARGGAWREHTNRLSWFNEARPAGRYLGRYADETAARAAGGGTNDWYARTGTVTFYSLNAGSGETQIYRAGAQAFPSLVLILAASDRAVIYDLTEPGAPMWLVALVGSGYHLGGSSTASSITAREGVIAIGFTANGSAVLNFPVDRNVVYHSAGKYIRNKPLSGRNSSNSYLTVTGAIVNLVINDVAAAVLPDTPMDPVTGAQTPTLAFATNGGVSVVNPDGTVFDSALTSPVAEVEFDAQGNLYYSLSTGNGTYVAEPRDYQAGDGFGDLLFDNTQTPAAIGSSNTGGLAGLPSGFALGTQNRMYTFTPRLRKLTQSMLAVANTAIPFHFQPGSCVGAFMASIDETDLAGSQLATNGGFDSDTAWTKGTGWSISAGVASSDGSQVSNSDLTQASSVPADTKDYVLEYTITSYTAGTLTALISGSVATDDAKSATGTYQLSFRGDGTARDITFRADADFVGSLDNVSLRLADADRCAKNNGLATHGTVVKTAVATGAELAAFSGFSNTIYLEQAPNTDLDFGTGDFYFAGWIKEAANTNEETIFSREYYSGGFSGAQMTCRVDTLGRLTFDVSDDGFVSEDNCDSSMAIDDDAWHLACIVRRGTKVEVWIDSIKDTSTTLSAAAGSLSNTNARLRFGLRNDTTQQPLTNGALALWRVGSYAPTAEQIRRIFENEKHLFLDNSKCTVDGTSDAVTAVSYDPDTQFLHVSTSWGRSTFHGLRLVSSEATAIGALTAVAGRAGAIVQVGASGADVYLPKINIRDHLHKALAVPVVSDLTYSARTTDASATDIAKIEIYEGELALIEATILARESVDGTTERALYRRQCLAYRDIGGNVTIQGSVQTIGTDVEVTAGMDATLQADTTNQTIDVNATGKAATAIEWLSQVKVTRISEKTY